MKKNLDSQRVALQNARDALQKGIDDYEETQGSKISVFVVLNFDCFDIADLV